MIYLMNSAVMPGWRSMGGLIFWLCDADAEHPWGAAVLVHNLAEWWEGQGEQH